MKYILAITLCLATTAYTCIAIDAPAPPIISIDRPAIESLAKQEACSREPTLHATNMVLKSITYTWADDPRTKYDRRMLTNRRDYLRIAFQLSDTVTNRARGTPMSCLEWQEVLVYLDLNGNFVEMKQWPAMYPLRPDVETNWINEAEQGVAGYPPQGVGSPER